MNKREIGINAEKVLSLLNNNQKWDIPKLCESTGLLEKDIYAAIGWLAHEDKVEIDQTTVDREQFYLMIEYYF